MTGGEVSVVARDDGVTGGEVSMAARDDNVTGGWWRGQLGGSR